MVRCLPVKLLVIRMEPSRVASQSVIFPMRHRSEVHPKVANQERILAEVDDRDVAEPTTLLLERRRALASAGDVENQRRVA